MQLRVNAILTAKYGLWCRRLREKQAHVAGEEGNWNSIQRSCNNFLKEGSTVAPIFSAFNTSCFASAMRPRL